MTAREFLGGTFVLILFFGAVHLIGGLLEGMMGGVIYP